MFVGNWYILDKIAQIASALSNNIETSQLLQEGNQRILSLLENVCSGSGIKAAG